ncbi:hypothetical protein [Promicromonospora panici]|uniref:hypothetical protein n=1 Tax=Promicromonospora panici TaxID=2219658 RepID=UPI00101B86EB|nr:hypothetical protein [Promicromonospora panici]
MRKTLGSCENEIMITGEPQPATATDTADDDDPVPTDLIDESNASYARIAPPAVRRAATRRGLLGGGDASKAPRNLAGCELDPISGASSGVSWDDPEEL